MSDIGEMNFKRLFSLTMYKNKKLKLGQMSFFKDFVNDTRGDLYPVYEKEGKIFEQISSGKYSFSSADGHILRLIGAYFPYASYEMSSEILNGKCGFSFVGKNRRADILFSEADGKYVCSCGDETFNSGIECVENPKFIVTCRGSAFDIYINSGSKPEFVHTFTAEEFKASVYYDEFKDMKAGVYLSGEAVVTNAEFYMDCGISQADMRPVKYENGEIMTENGKVYLTMSVRMQAGWYQGVFSWVPGSAEFELCGALFFDTGDGMWGDDVASSVLYHREEKMWYLWVCSFSHGHILGYAKSEGDMRFGVNAVDITLMDKMTEESSDEEFLGKEGDEDPDFIYDKKSGKWLMSICRLVEEDGKENYRYFLFESDNPFAGYKHIANAKSGAETGGSFVKTDKGIYFVCGNGFDKRAEYRIYIVPNMDEYELIRCDYDDGGFRGWGTVMPLKAGTRTKYYHLTFDRHNGSEYNWSYGNIYCYVAE